MARVSGARVIAVHATGHQLHEIVRALRAARVPAEIVVAGRGVDERTLVELGRGGPLYAASAWHRADVPDLVVALERGTGARADAVTALGYDVAGAARRRRASRRLADLRHRPGRAGLVVRRAASGRTSVVARRDVPAEVPDLDAVAAVPAIAALPPPRLTRPLPSTPARRACANRAAVADLASPAMTSVPAASPRRLLLGAALAACC